MEKKWWHKTVGYQIYPKSFQDTNGDGIGDLQGIIKKLDYIKNLGITVIWVSPIYKSPNKDNGYDISDYQDIMDEFGTMEDFDTLLREMHKRDIKLVMDLVVNHSSDEHAWFVESRKSRDNPYRDYYIWRDGKNGREPNNWSSFFTPSAWSYDEKTGQWYLHLFSEKQPDLNWENPKLREAVYAMMNRWFDRGVDGFRMDVISLISKPEEYKDGPVKEGEKYSFCGAVTANGPHEHEYLQEMNQKVLSRYNLLTVGETSCVTLEEAKKYARSDGKELSMVFQFEHMDVDSDEHGKWTDKKLYLPDLKEVLNRWQKGLEEVAWNSLYWNNHDQPRVVSRWGNDSGEYRELSAKMLATCLHMMQGTPYVYQGEELGMTNMHFSDVSECDDIEEKNIYIDLVTDTKVYTHDQMMDIISKKGRDNARTPMQWDDSANAGFTTGTPWIKVNDNYDKINAKSQVDDPDSIFSCYKKLVQLRKDYPVFVDGKFTLLLEDDENIFAYSRKNEEKTMIVVCNFFDKEIPMPLAKECEGMEVLISNYKDTSDMSVLRPYEARMYIR